MNKELKDMDLEDLINVASWKVIEKTPRGNLREAVSEVVHLTMGWLREKKDGSDIAPEARRLSLGVNSEGQALEVYGDAEAIEQLREALFSAEQLQESRLTQTRSYVQVVSDHCDRIVWRRRYYSLPLGAPVGPHESQDSNAAGMPYGKARNRATGVLQELDAAVKTGDTGAACSARSR